MAELSPMRSKGDNCMWKEYSLSYIKNNKIASISLMVAALISAMFLSLITSVFYNMWTDNISQIVSKEGDWQAKIVGNISKEDLRRIESNAKVKAVITTQTGIEMETIIYFYEMRNIYKVMPKLVTFMDIDETSIQYHEKLLSEYFIFNPEEDRPPLLLAFYVFVMLIASISLILVIRNAFMVSMQSRLHQFGILQSIGATPRQLKLCLLQEAFGLCLLPIILGIGTGVGLCLGFLEYANRIAGAYRGNSAVFTYRIELFLITFIVALLTVLCSAWLPARKLNKLSPLQVLKEAEEQKAINKVKKYRFISLIFGIEGELARKSLYARRKSLRTSTLSLTLSFFSFSIFLCFITLSEISTNYTYFERYQNAWDIMVTLRDPNIIEQNEDLRDKMIQIRSMEDVESTSVYQKALAFTYVEEDMLSNELQALGGFSNLAGSDSNKMKNRYKVKVPILILDNISFEKYLKSIGSNSDSKESGMVVINRIWNNVHSNYRNKQYVSFIREQEGDSLLIFQREESNQGVEIPILAYSKTVPNLREEYANYALVQVVSISTWQKFFGTFEVEEKETYVNIQTAAEDAIPKVQSDIEQIFYGDNIEIENRIEEKQFNEEAFKGYAIIMGALCGLLALIGVANVFSYTLGFILQRKREFARYLSIGLTPNGMKRILFLEAITIGGKPIAITVPFAIIFVVFAANESDISLAEFLENLPILPLSLFAIMILGFVALAYYIGGRKISKLDLIGTLKDDTLG